MASSNDIRNRIVDYRTVRAGDLLPDPRNWRRHPASQRKALGTMLECIGWADAVIARETPDGLMLIDGHLRADLRDDAQIPVLVVDLDDDEAGQVLATLDPLAAIAEADADALASLVASLEVPPPMDLSTLYDLPVESIGETHWPERGPETHTLGFMRFIVSEAQRDLIEQTLSLAISMKLDSGDPDNENRNGNALAAICQHFQALSRSA